MKLIVVRSGSATFVVGSRSQQVTAGDVVVLDANTLCKAEPKGQITTTTLYIDRDYLVDQVFWQYSSRFTTREDADQFLKANCTQATQLIRLHNEQVDILTPWLDELTNLSQSGLSPDSFYQFQALVASVLHVVTPRLPVKGAFKGRGTRNAVVPSSPRHRFFRPIRPEARKAAELLSGELDRHWSVAELADAVFLSRSQLGRVFTEAFGKSPIAYLTMLRAERMAHLLKVTDSPIAVIATSVGWGDPDFAARQFRRSIGVTPSEYRRISRETPLPTEPE